ncbi:ABC transporter permease (plasmid) [Halorussus limi]|uniref:ABC transporter permease n=1 Tax=Halorussus limi TaxID=2938695 RepID=A0A8U0HZA2_9EURY|nr:ABC transporter permease subunit [Halorussus limi]UPV76360.1 ABC transporter permease [Halorussus limi]
MSLSAVVKKDFRDSIRSHSLVSVTALFALFAAGLAAMQFVPTMYRDSGVETSTLALLNSMRQPTVFFVPLVGLALSYRSILGERESGSIKLLLGLPNARRDVVLGKFLGRTAVVAVSILASYAVAGTVALLTYDSFDFVVFALYTLLTLFYGAVYIGIGIGFSAVSKSREWALAGAAALYALFLVGWDVLLLLLQFAVVGPASELPESGLPDWMDFVGLLNPSSAFMKATRAVIPEYRELTVFPEASALYLQDWFGFVILAFWGGVPLYLGYRRFDGMDLQT